MAQLGALGPLGGAAIHPFVVSAVDGAGVALLRAFLQRLPAPGPQRGGSEGGSVAAAAGYGTGTAPRPFHMEVDDVFRLLLDTVVTGTVAGAPLAAGGAQLLALGPAAAGGFLRVRAWSRHVRQEEGGEAVAGQAVAVALDCAETAAPAPASTTAAGGGGGVAAALLALARSARRGMVLADGAAGLPRAVREFGAEVELLGGGAALRGGAQFTLHAGAACQVVQLLRALAAAEQGRCRSRLTCQHELVRRAPPCCLAAAVGCIGGGVRRGR